MRPTISTYGLRISASVFIYMHAYACVVTFSASGGKPRVQKGDSGNYTDAVFGLLAQKEAEIWTFKFIASFYQVKFIIAPRLVEFV